MDFSLRQHQPHDYPYLFGYNQALVANECSQSFDWTQQPSKAQRLDFLGNAEEAFDGILSPLSYSPTHSASSSPPRTPTNANWAVSPVTINAPVDPLPTVSLPTPMDNYLLPQFNAQLSPFPDTMSLLQPVTPSTRTDRTSLDNCFLQPQDQDLRNLLDLILQQPWYLTSQKEPDVDSKRSVLTRFLRRSSDGQSFGCRFDGCDKTFDRQDRAVGHIRMHIGLRPFACGGQCKETFCNERFFCPSYLASHIKRPMKRCDKCHQSFHKQPMRRHSVTCTGMPLLAHPHPLYRPY